MSKGSGRRPSQIPEEQEQKNWEQIFGKKQKPEPKEQQK